MVVQSIGWQAALVAAGAAALPGRGRGSAGGGQGLQAGAGDRVVVLRHVLLHHGFIFGLDLLLLARGGELAASDVDFGAGKC